jgi:hypothetical protein
MDLLFRKYSAMLNVSSDLCSHPVVQMGKNLFPNTFGLLAEFVMAVKLHFLAGESEGPCFWLPAIWRPHSDARGCPKLLSIWISSKRLLSS